MSRDDAWQRYVAEAMTATVKGPLTRSMAAHVLAMHLAQALGGDPGKDSSSVLYPLCSQLVATLEDQGYVLHGELPAAEDEEEPAWKAAEWVIARFKGTELNADLIAKALDEAGLLTRGGRPGERGEQR